MVHKTPAMISDTWAQYLMVFFFIAAKDQYALAVPPHAASGAPEVTGRYQSERTRGLHR